MGGVRVECTDVRFNHLKSGETIFTGSFYIECQELPPIKAKMRAEVAKESRKALAGKIGDKEEDYEET